MAEQNKSSQSDKFTITRLQKLLSDPNKRIELHNLVALETAKVVEAIANFNVQPSPSDADVIKTAKAGIKEFEEVSKNLRIIAAYGGYFGTPEQAYLWTGMLSDLASVPHSSGNSFLLSLQFYPALLIEYSLGLAALSSKNEVNLKAVFDVQANQPSQSRRPLVFEANCTMLADAGNQILGYERRKTPLSDHLFDLFSESFPKTLFFGQNFGLLFDDWEILVGMVYAYESSNNNMFGSWAPVGRFSWRNRHSEDNIIKITKALIGKENSEWPPLKAGLFNGSPVNASQALEVVEGLAERVSFF